MAGQAIHIRITEKRTNLIVRIAAAGSKAKFLSYDIPQWAIQEALAIAIADDKRFSEIDSNCHLSFSLKKHSSFSGGSMKHWGS